MKNPFSPGDQKIFRHKVTEADSAAFESGQVHNVYSTFALARDAEWAGRLFVLEMREEGEEGIGTGLEIRHLSPALMGSEVIFTATLEAVHKNEVINSFRVTVHDRIIAEGKQWQKIISQEKLNRLFESLDQ